MTKAPASIETTPGSFTIATSNAAMAASTAPPPSAATAVAASTLAVFGAAERPASSREGERVEAGRQVAAGQHRSRCVGRVRAT